jgi:hypothetical protein
MNKAMKKVVASLLLYAIASIPLFVLLSLLGPKIVSIISITVGFFGIAIATVAIIQSNGLRGMNLLLVCILLLATNVMHKMGVEIPSVIDYGVSILMLGIIVNSIASKKSLTNY